MNLKGNYEMVRKVMTLVDQLRGDTKKAKAANIDAASLVQATVRASVARIKREVKESIPKIFTEVWLPEINKAVASGKYSVSLRLGYPDRGPDRIRHGAKVQHGKEYLENQGFSVIIHCENRSYADDDLGREETDLIVSWE